MKTPFHPLSAGRASGDAEPAPGGAAAAPAPQFEAGMWSRLVERIQAGDQAAMSELYQRFSRGVRYYLCRHTGAQELDDRVHDTFVIVVQAIQRGDLRDPERLMGFVRTVARRQIAGFIESAVAARRDFADLEVGARIPDASVDHDRSVVSDENRKLIAAILEEISPRDREVLTRFYLYEQTQEQICAEMGLSETQFRLLKSRAKARFGELGRRRLATSGFSRLFSLRRSSGT
jgi:RNA polymerase sigma-70 factor (ECF subfamily)